MVRSIGVTVSALDTVSLSRSGSTDGYEGEHLATRLAVTVPVSWDTYTAYVTWEASDGWSDESDGNVIAAGDPTFSYDLPAYAMKRGPLKCSITAKVSLGGSLGTQVVHTANFTLNISASVDGAATYVGPAYDAVEALDARIQVLEANANNIDNSADYFDINPGTDDPAYKEGRFWWSDELGTMQIHTDIPGVVLQVGHEGYIRCRNNTGAIIGNGKVVYISGAVGQYPTIALARANAAATSGLIGVATHDIGINDLGNVTIMGTVNEMDTSLSGLASDGQPVYLSSTTAGELVPTPPALPSIAVLVGIIAYAHAVHGKLLVMPGPAWNTTAGFNILGAKDLRGNIAKMGDVAGGNYTEFESDGTMVSVGNATVWDDLVVSLANAKAPAATTPTWTSYKGAEVPAFSASAVNTIYFTVQLPHTYKEGTDVEFHIHVAYPDAGTGFTAWQMTHSWANMDGTFPSPTTTTKVKIAAPGTGGADKHKLIELVAAISGSGKTISSVIICSLSRLGNDATDDTYANVVYGLSADFHYQKDTLGSRTPVVK